MHPAGDRQGLPCHRVLNDDVLSLLQTKGNTDYTLLRIRLNLFQHECSFSVMIYTCDISEKNVRLHNFRPVMLRLSQPNMKSACEWDLLLMIDCIVCYAVLAIFQSYKEDTCLVFTAIEQ